MSLQKQRPKQKNLTGASQFLDEIIFGEFVSTHFNLPQTSNKERKRTEPPTVYRFHPQLIPLSRMTPSVDMASENQ
jgi:hypothetical protein